MSADRIAEGAMVALAALFAWVFYDLVLDSWSPLSVDPPTILSTLPVPRNGALQLSYTITVDRICTGEGERLFVDAGGVPHAGSVFSEDTSETNDGKPVRAGDVLTRQIAISVPSGMAPGPATYQNQVTMYCNFWQRAARTGIAYEFPEVHFSVADSALPQVVPSSSIFKMHRHDNMLDWLRKRMPTRSVP